MNEFVRIDLCDGQRWCIQCLLTSVSRVTSSRLMSSVECVSPSLCSREQQCIPAGVLKCFPFYSPMYLPVFMLHGKHGPLEGPFELVITVCVCIFKHWVWNFCSCVSLQMCVFRQEMYVCVLMYEDRRCCLNVKGSV